MKGIYTALITPYTKSGKIDYASLNYLLSLQNNSAVTGVVLFGSTGEEKLITPHEKLSILKAATKILKNKQIYVGVNEFSIDSAKRAIKELSVPQINGYLISPPAYIKLSQTEVINFYSQIADCTDKDICIYNIPSRTGTMISVETVLQLSKISNITAIKDATGDLQYTKSLIKQLPTSFSMLCGNDNLYIDMKKLGCSGAVCVIGNLYPNLFCSQIESNKKLQQQYIPTIQYLSARANPAGIKFLLSKYLHTNNILRSPLLPQKD